MVWNTDPTSFFRSRRDDRPGERGPSYDSFRGSVWRRHLRPPSALAVVVMVALLAMVAAFVATVVFANIDAGRPLAQEDPIASVPTTVPATPGEATVPTPGGVGTPGTPAILTNELIEQKINSSLWLVSTRTEVGAAIEGSAFTVGSFGGQTLLLTSLSTVRAATRTPAPEISVSQGSRTVVATLWTWEESRDLALLTVSAGSPSLTLGNSAAVQRGDRIYTGAPARAMTPGIVTAAAADGIEHNIVIDGLLEGSPIVNQRGEVVAMASAAYNPGGRGTTTVFVGVPIALACERVLRCGAGNTEPSSTPSPTTTTRP